VRKHEFKKASDRNLLKRITREFFRHNQGNFKGDYEIVVRFGGAAKGAKREMLRALLEEMFRKAKIL